MRSVLASSLFVLGLSTTGYVHADGTETLGTPSTSIASGATVVTSGVGLDNSEGDILLTLPPGATVNQVLLYWSSRGNVEVDTLSVDGNTVDGDIIGGPANFPQPTMQGPSRSYRADITDLDLVGPGDNVVNVSTTLPAGSLEGASLVVIFGDQSVVRFGGRAFAIGIPQLGPLQSFIADTGQLPPGGGALTPAPVARVFLPGLLRARAVDAGVVGAGGQTESFASIAALRLGIAPLNLGLGVVQSTATAECTAAGLPRVRGGSRILGISGTVGGQTPNIPIGVPANTVVLNILGVVRIVANEQTASVSGGSGTITVTALHITSPLILLTRAIDIRLAQSTASIRCGDALPDSDIHVLDGNDFAFANYPVAGKFRSTKLQTFTFAPTAFDRTAQLHLLVGDGEAGRPDVIQITNADGTTDSFPDFLNSSSGFEWDNDTLLVPVPAGATTLGVRLLSKRSPRSTTDPTATVDSIHWVAAILSLPTTPGTNLYSGRATVVLANVANLVEAVVADTGPLPPTGGQLTAEILNADVPLLLQSSTARARTVGAGEVSAADAILEDLDLTLGATILGGPLGLNLSADVIESNAIATCSASNVAVVAGSSTIANLVVNGNAYPIAIDDTVVINLLGILRIYINEKIIIGNDGSNVGSITVNALRVNVPDILGLLGTDLVNVILSSSHADIVCL
ncbi:MAG: choice-of-anchor P family protein [Panacagrimonas sp.]